MLHAAIWARDNTVALISPLKSASKIQKLLDLGGPSDEIGCVASTAWHFDTI
jgi:hypothetical protein